jgi:hypothetical protein
MNRNVTLLVGATVGGAVGYFVSAVVADYIEEKEIRDQAPVVVEEDEQPTDDDEESSPGNSIMSKKKNKTKKEHEKVNYTAYFNSINRPDLAALARKYNEGEHEEPHNDGVVAQLIAVNETETFNQDKPPVDGIMIIDHEQFNNNADDFEVVNLTYYADDIMIGEDDNIIYGPEDIIGSDALSSFGMLSGDPDIVYVRNPKARALYEIVRVSVKYAIDAEADEIIPRRGLKKGIDFDEVSDEENDEEANS